MRTIEFKGSSNVKSAVLGDDGVCTVTFANNATYSYANMTPALMDEWEAAQSAGKWFHNRIRAKPLEFPVKAKTPGSTTSSPPPGVPATVEVKADKVTDDERNRWAAKIKEQTETIAKLQLALKAEQKRADNAEADAAKLRAAAESKGDGGKVERRMPWQRRGRRF